MKAIPAILWLAALPAFAQDSATDPAGGGTALAQMAKLKAQKAGATPRASDGKPDFSGIWTPDRSFIYDISTSLAPGEQLPMQPWAAEATKKRMSHDDPEANCLPTGIPRGSPYPWRIAQTPGIYFIVFEGNIHSWRQIFMDDRKHPADPDPAWYGHSIGHWEGKTLVVDTVGFNDKFWFDFRGHPHTEQLHTIERYTRKDLGTLENKVTIIDPGDYSKPFTLTFTARLRPKEELMEYICQENQQDSQHMHGSAGLPQNP